MASRPIYAQLADELRRDIHAGTWQPGDLFPTEMELAKQRGLSRSTVRAALSRLVDLGLIQRQQGAGTRVCRINNEGRFEASIDTMDELAQFGLATERVVQDTSPVVLDTKNAARLDLPPGSRWVRINTIRTRPDAPDRPICCTSIYLDPRYEAALAGLERYRGLVTDLLRATEGVEIDSVEQVIRPVQLMSNDAALLQAEPGQSALEITRCYRSASSVISVSVSLHPSDRFEYRTVLKRQKFHPSAPSA